MATVGRRQRNARGQGSRLRSEIVTAAMRLIDAGDGPLTLRGIAREAQIASPSIYGHFSYLGQIDLELIRTCYDGLISQIQTALTGVDDPVERLQVTCEAYLAYGAAHPRRYALLFQAERDQVERAAVGERGSAALQTLVDAIEACQAAGRAEGTDPYHDAVAVWSAIHGLTTLRSNRPHFEQLHDPEITRSVVHRLARIAPT